MGRLFRAHGEFCASHPWEVIVALLTLTICMLTVDKGNDGSLPKIPKNRQCQGWRDSCEGHEAEYNAADVILMIIVRCSAVLYCYYQFFNLHKLGSKYILGIAVLFIVFASFIFTSFVINLLGSEASDLKDGLFFFLLLIDLSKAGTLAQFALCGNTPSEVTNNIARGMELLGPAISLDTLVETLLIGVGTLSGVPRLEALCGFAVMSVFVNYIVFMTFYPACLSLVLDLSSSVHKSPMMKGKSKDSMLLRSWSEENQKPNPVVQRVKIIMSTGLVLVHALSRLTFIDKTDMQEQSTVTATVDPSAQYNITESFGLSEAIIKWFTMKTEDIAMFIFVLALLLLQFIFSDREEKLAVDLAQLREQLTEEKIKLNEQSIPKIISVPLNDTKKIERPSQKAIFTIDEGVLLVDETTQTESPEVEYDENFVVNEEITPTREPRSLNECIAILNSEDGPAQLSDDEIIKLVNAGGGICPLYKIETIIGNLERGVKIRRKVLTQQAKLPPKTLNGLSYLHYDYSKVMNACCENVLGYVQIPVGYAGPLTLDGRKYYIPMATTEGALVASTNRGCKAISIQGVSSFVEDIGMTRAPCVKFINVHRASVAKRWMESADNYEKIKKAFDSTSRFARLQELFITMDGPQLYIRFRALTGDAMGMNMVSKGAEMALRVVEKVFPDMQIISLSGNFCSDKKPAAINWIKGRGKRVVCETIIPREELHRILKTNAATLVQCNKLKNMVGSAMAGSIGGNNAHAANMVTAIFIATGQDPAQNVTSSNCSTAMELCGDTLEDLYMTCTMPSLEVGTVGGGTGLSGQSACLEMLGVKGAHKTNAGENSRHLAKIICATVMAGELSLMAALVNSDLVKSHMRHNRSSVVVNPMLSNPGLDIKSPGATQSQPPPQTTEPSSITTTN